MNNVVELVRKSDAVAKLAEALESEAQLAVDLEISRERSEILDNYLATERQRSGILLVVCILLFLLSMVLLVVTFA